MITAVGLLDQGMFDLAKTFLAVMLPILPLIPMTNTVWAPKSKTAWAANVPMETEVEDSPV